MALVVADRVKQTAATISGTGTYTLSGTFTGFQTFTDGVGDGNTTYYAAVQDANFEIGIGTYTASGTTLARTTILQSSNSDNAVNWSSATPTIFTTYPADKAVFKDASNNINGTFVGNITGNVTGNTSGTAATVTGAAQTNITSVGTLSSLTTSGDISVGDDLTVNGGQIDLKTNSGAVAKMLFYCESGNAHAQTLQAQPHSAASSAVLVLPTASGTLLGSGDAVSVKNSYLLDTDIKIGEDDQTKIDFETADEIHFYAANVEQVYLADNIFGPQSDSDVDLGTTSVRWKDAYVDSVTVTDNVTIGGNLTVNGTTTTIDTTNTVVKDSLLGLNNGASSNSNDSGIIIERGSTGNDALLIWDESADKWALGTTTDNASSTGNLNMTTGTLVANIEGNVTGNADTATTATNATHVTVTDNESTAEANLITFVENAQTGTGNHGLEMDGNFKYNPSTGTVMASIFRPENGNQANIMFTNASGQLCFGMDGDSSKITFFLDDEDGQPIFTFQEEDGTDIMDGGDTDVTVHKPFIANSTITASGRIIVDDTTEATTTTDGSIQTDGGLSVAKDIVVGDDIKLGDNIAFTSDGAVLYFGVNSEVTVSHIHNTGLLLNSSRQLQFGDSGTYIHQSADGVLDLVADTELELNGAIVDVNSTNGNVDISATGGNIQLTGDTGNSVKVTGVLETTGNIELGNSSDTTLSRASAGVMAVEGNEVLTSSTGATKGFVTAMAIAL